MPAKGSGKMGCCCGGCAEPPTDFLLARGLHQPLQQYCCACVPKHICATYDCNGTSSQAIIPLVRPCAADDHQSVYRGKMPIDGAMCDVEWFFQVEGGVCSICFKSTYLGETGTSCIVMDDDARDILCERCESCSTESLQWQLNDAPDCSPYATMDIRPASMLPISPPLEKCCDCPDPRDDHPYETQRDTPCGGICGGCDCICKVAEITVWIDGDVSSTSATACNWKWGVGTDFVVELVKNASDGCCALRLNVDEDINTGAPLDDVAIGEQSANDCPSPEAEWDFTDPDTGKDYKVYFHCHQCGEVEQVIVSGCCDDNVPKVLTASVDGGASCCGSFTVTLVYNEVSGIWEGSHPTAMCDHDVEITVSCGDSAWSISYDGTGCTADNDNATGTCDPVNLSATLNAGGVGCCDELGNPGTLTITVTE